MLDHHILLHTKPMTAYLGYDHPMHNMQCPPRFKHVIEINWLVYRPGESVSCSLAILPIRSPWRCFGFWAEDPEVAAVQAAPVSKRSSPQNLRTRPTWATSPSTPCRATSTPSSKTSVWGAWGSSVTKRQTSSKVSCSFCLLLVRLSRWTGGGTGLGQMPLEPAWGVVTGERVLQLWNDTLPAYVH